MSKVGVVGVGVPLEAEKVNERGDELMMMMKGRSFLVVGCVGMGAGVGCEVGWVLARMEVVRM